MSAGDRRQMPHPQPPVLVFTHTHIHTHMSNRRINKLAETTGVCARARARATGRGGEGRGQRTVVVFHAPRGSSTQTVVQQVTDRDERVPAPIATTTTNHK